MYLYFSCGFPAAIKFNGVYYGIIDDSVKSCNFENGFFPLVEICPLRDGDKQLSFLADYNFLSNPPENVLITDLCGGYLIRIEKSRRFDGFKVLAQQKFPDLLVTVFAENQLKISIESKNDFYIETINASPSSVEINKFQLDNRNFLSVFFLGEENLLFVYDILNKTRKVFFRPVSAFSIDDGFSTTETFKDMAKHSVTTKWRFENGVFSALSKSIVKSPNFNVADLPTALLPFAFFEDLVVGDSVLDYLCDNMKEHADKLIGFLGEFIGVMPPPLFREIDQIGLIYPNGKNKYLVNYYGVEIHDRKIFNVKLLTDTTPLTT